MPVFNMESKLSRGFIFSAVGIQRYARSLRVEKNHVAGDCGCGYPRSASPIPRIKLPNKGSLIRVADPVFHFSYILEATSKTAFPATPYYTLKSGISAAVPLATIGR